MTVGADNATPFPPRPLLALLGLGLLAYAVLGNWLVLPGYRRFLEHGSPNAGAPGPDFAYIWGATRTVLWMFAFHIGALCLAYRALALAAGVSRSFRLAFLAIAALWIVLWAIPTLPGPYTAYFATLGIVIMGLIAATLLRLPRAGPPATGWLIAGLFFFALATWDICGLGSVGGILHPDSARRAASQDLVVAQTSKLILEVAFAWAACLLALRRPV